MSERPLRIGLSVCYDHADPQRRMFTGKTLYYVEASMARWVQAAGVLTYPVAPAGEQGLDIDATVADLDGLVLHGGADVCPRTYGEEPMRPEWEGDEERDRYEIDLIQRFRAQRKPVLGICRGAQVLNVALGGTLYQDISTQVDTQRVHRDAVAYDRNLHLVDVLPDTVLASVLGGGAGRYEINSVHHQAIKDPAPGTVVEARSSDDGVVEAIRAVDDAWWGYGVQWHPEFFGPGDEALLDTVALRSVFVDQALARRDRP